MSLNMSGRYFGSLRPYGPRSDTRPPTKSSTKYFWKASLYDIILFLAK